MTIVDWFDPNSTEHVKAYHFLETAGFWPEGFLPKDIEIPSTWHFSILGKMAKCWMSHVLTEQPRVLANGLESGGDRGYNLGS